MFHSGERRWEGMSQSFQIIYFLLNHKCKQTLLQDKLKQSRPMVLVILLSANGFTSKGSPLWAIIKFNQRIQLDRPWTWITAETKVPTYQKNTRQLSKTDSIQSWRWLMLYMWHKMFVAFAQFWLFDSSCIFSFRIKTKWTVFTEPCEMNVCVPDYVTVESCNFPVSTVGSVHLE